MLRIKEQDAQWVLKIWQQIEDKMAVTIKDMGTKIPYTTVDGVFDDKFDTDPSWWTNGFWGGTLMTMYEATNEHSYLELANALEDRMDAALLLGDSDLHHDVGFMWYLSSGLNYKLTGNQQSGKRTLAAANILASRFSIKGGYIVAWNGVDRQGWSIIDSMMNIPLLFFATKETGYQRYKDVAIAHADKTLANFIREDGSVNHIVVYDHETGEPLKSLGGQGYGEGSSWTRGQAWAINGFAQAYAHTGNVSYLEASKKVAHYFLTCVSETDFVPAIDFRSPKSPSYIDTTAGVIAASGLIDLAEYVGENEQSIYLDGALKILKALVNKACDFETNRNGILNMGSEAYEHGRHMYIIYGDYYLIETVLKCIKIIKNQKTSK